MDGSIVDLFFDVRVDEWTEGFKGKDVNLVTEQIFEEETELDEIVIVFLPGVESYDQVDVAILPFLSPRV